MITKNQPNAAKLLSSLRNTGYDSYTAIEDIIDNSVDAKATQIKVEISETNKEFRIIIADNGIGMDDKILDEALKLGSATQKDELSDLGKYGMGLCTASISIARRLEVVTKKKNSRCLYSSQDLDDVARTDDFIKELRGANNKEIYFLEQMSEGDSGTVVILNKVDRLSNSNLSAFVSTLSREIGRIYRRFIQSGTSFYVNNKRIDAIDPLMQEDLDTQIYSDEEYELPMSYKNKIRVKIVLLPNVNSQLAKEKKMNIKSQGFYILRNNREIANGVTLDVFKKHNDFNRVRAELSFVSDIDNEMGVRFSKDGISPNQIINDFLKQEISGQFESIRRSITKSRVFDESAEIDHEESATVIAEKSKLLITPEAIIEKRSSRTMGEDRSKPKPTEDNRERIPKETRVSPSGLGARFEMLSMGREGSLYDCYQEGKVIVIQWNIDHPFYEQIIIANKDRKELVSGMDYLIYALASAELKTTNDDNVELIGTIKTIMSANLRSLMS